MISVVIVNWNSGALLSRCLCSLEAALAGSALECEVIVVDNGSKDTSLAATSGTVLDLRTIANAENLGFGRACNQGAALARGEYLLFLNPDCEVRRGSLERCITELQRTDLAVGTCGVALEDEGGCIARSCHRFPTFKDLVLRATGLFRLAPRLGGGAMLDWDHGNDATVDHVIGAFYLIRTDLFRRLKGFDERFFVYLEDLDLSLRVRQAGYVTRFVAAPASFHVGGGVSRQVKAARLFYATRSRVLYAFKHFGFTRGWLHLLLTLVAEPCARLAHALFTLSRDTIAETAGAYARLYRDLPAILRRAHGS